MSPTTWGSRGWEPCPSLDVRWRCHWRRALLEGTASEVRIGLVVAVVGWWRCSCVASREVRLVHVGREVQKTHGCWSLGGLELACLVRW
jgi:hypothetical protein